MKEQQNIFNEVGCMSLNSMQRYSADLIDADGRKVFLQLGFIISLALMLVAFEWTTQDRILVDLQRNGDSPLENQFEEVIIDRPVEKIERPKPKFILTEIINIIGDEEDDLEDILFFDPEEDGKAIIIPELPPEEPEDGFYFEVSDMPIFRPSVNKTTEAGELDLMKFIAKNINYPNDARMAGIEGKVYVEFIVNSKGKVVDVSLARGIFPSINEEALRVIKSLPAFKPGRQSVKLVNVKYTIPINFKLS